MDILESQNEITKLRASKNFILRRMVLPESPINLPPSSGFSRSLKFSQPPIPSMSSFQYLNFQDLPTASLRVATEYNLNKLWPVQVEHDPLSKCASN